MSCGLTDALPPWHLLVVSAFAVTVGACVSGSRSATVEFAGAQGCVPSEDTTLADTAEIAPRIRSLPDGGFYPPEFRGTGLSARVFVAMVIGHDGLPELHTIRVVGNGPYAPFDIEAIRFVRGVRFWPGCFGGKTVRVQSVLPVDFKDPQARPRD